jgi:hypothetical protein
VNVIRGEDEAALARSLQERGNEGVGAGGPLQRLLQRKVFKQKRAECLKLRRAGWRAQNITPVKSRSTAQTTAVDAAVILRRMAYRPRLVHRMGQRVNYFHAATAIANKAGIFYLTRTLDFAAMPDIVADLERHWRNIGLMEHAA